MWTEIRNERVTAKYVNQLNRTKLKIVKIELFYIDVCFVIST